MLSDKNRKLKSGGVRRNNLIWICVCSMIMFSLSFIGLNLPSSNLTDVHALEQYVDDETVYFTSDDPSADKHKFKPTDSKVKYPYPNPEFVYVERDNLDDGNVKFTVIFNRKCRYFEPTRNVIFLPENATLVGEITRGEKHSYQEGDKLDSYKSRESLTLENWATGSKANTRGKYNYPFRNYQNHDMIRTYYEEQAGRFAAQMSKANNPQFYWAVFGDTSNNKLSDDFKSKHQDVPWTAIKGMRNRIIHDYGGVVYDTVSSGIPEMLSILKKIKN